jgi:hypothetical protein
MNSYSYSDDQKKLTGKKMNGNNKMHVADIKTSPLFYGKKTTKTNEPNHISMQMADYCTQLFFLS